jgi:hypothetical protein
MKTFSLPLFLCFSFLFLAVSACSPSLAPSNPQEMPSPTPTLGSPAAPPGLTATPTQAPEPTATVEQSGVCPDSIEGTQLLIREELGYCLLYPEGYIEVDTEPAQVCLVPGEPYLACHSANAFVNVEDAAGRSANQIAAEVIAGEEAAIPGIKIQRMNIMVSGEPAVMLEGLSGMAASRVILIVHNERLYRLTFVPWDETGDEFERVEALYNTLISSFTFLDVVSLSETP